MNNSMSKLENRGLAILRHINENVDPSFEDIFRLFKDHDVTELAISSLIEKNVIFVNPEGNLKRPEYEVGYNLTTTNKEHN